MDQLKLSGIIPEDIPADLVAWFRRRLLKWHKGRTRDFAWRKTRNPWLVLMAEILLQRTESKQVEPIYLQAVQKYATPRQFVRAPLSSLNRLFGPLGLAKRVAMLRSIARQIDKQLDGKVPAQEADLLHLTGVGRYTANAVLCFAFDRDVPIVDSNIIRVFERFFGLRSTRNRPRDDPGFWRFAKRLIAEGRARETNLALLDFEAVVCTPRNPACPTCPVNARCLYWNRVRKLQRMGS